MKPLKRRNLCHWYILVTQQKQMEQTTKSCILPSKADYGMLPLVIKNKKCLLFHENFKSYYRKICLFSRATSSEQESISVEAQIPASYNPQNDMTDYISEENANTSENNVVFPTVKNGATGKKEFTSLQYLGNKNKDPHCSKTEEPAFDRAEISKSHNAGQGHIWYVGMCSVILCHENQDSISMLIISDVF